MMMMETTQLAHFDHGPKTGTIVPVPFDMRNRRICTGFL